MVDRRVKKNKNAFSSTTLPKSVTVAKAKMIHASRLRQSEFNLSLVLYIVRYSEQQTGFSKKILIGLPTFLGASRFLYLSVNRHIRLSSRKKV